MSLPGPAFGPWVFELLLYAAGFMVLGEAVRRGLARYARLLADPRPVERVLVDLYLGGGVLYVLSAIPLGLFYPETAPALIALAAVVLTVLEVRGRGARGAWLGARRIAAQFSRAPILAGLGIALLLLLLELDLAISAPSGNTFDSSLLTFFVSRLVSHHTIPLTFLPDAPFNIAYPQGTTVWLAAYQTAFALPPARTSLLVTPLFLGLGPLGAYALGDRIFRTPKAGAVLAGVFALMGSSTRVLVGGSNDFVLAFPLVLLLAGWSTAWGQAKPPGWGDAIAFGAMAGVAASLNPAGPVWIFLSVALLGAAARPAFSSLPRLWWSRWTAAALVGAAFVIPSLYEELAGSGGLFHAGLPAGAISPPMLAPPGTPPAQALGFIDPYLFRTNDVFLSPFPIVRAELITLLTIGAIALLLARRLDPKLAERVAAFRLWAVSGAAAAVLIVLAGVLAYEGVPLLGRLLGLTSLGETSILLFALYASVGAIPILLLAEGIEARFASTARSAGPGEGSDHEPRWRRGTASPLGALGSIGCVVLLFVPGVVSTVASLPGYETTLYRSLGNVTESDFDLLHWAGGNLPAGARVLVAPGSAAEFLPGYSPSSVLLFPMVDGVYVNGSYALLVRELTNATLDAAGDRAMADLGVGYVAVTQANSVLFRAFSPAPLLGQGSYTVLFHEGDAFLFERV